VSDLEDATAERAKDTQ